jgi:comEA protein
MKQRYGFQNILIGFLSGVLITGMSFLLFPIFQNTAKPSFSITSSAQTNENNLQVSPITDEGKINLNTAAEEELMTLPGIGQSKAASIIDFRTKYGAFENVSELSYVQGFGRALLDSIQDKVTVGN